MVRGAALLCGQDLRHVVTEAEDHLLVEVGVSAGLDETKANDPRFLEVDRPR